MPAPRPPARRPADGLLHPRPLASALDDRLPTVRIKTPTSHPLIFRKRVGEVEPGTQAGDMVRVTYGTGDFLGYGLYNPRAEIAVRMLTWGETVPDVAWWRGRLESALYLRRQVLKLDEVADTYRVVHAESDGLPGLVIDRFGEVLSAEVFSLAMYQRVRAILDQLEPLCGTRHRIIRTGPQVHGQEGFQADPESSEGCPPRVTIQEYGTRFRVHFEGGHKTGFFCDQRENRRKLAEFCEGKEVLDLCSYTGGFAVQAKRLGKAAAVTAVELDEEPLLLAKENANLNQARVQFVQADVFAWMRDMIQNGKQFDVVVLDPPKLIRSRRELDEGTKKHYDLNRLALQLVRPGGIFLSCSCAGLLEEAEFLRLLHNAARAIPVGSTIRPPPRTLRILARTGASADHPVAAHCPETEYLKAVWMCVD